MNALVVSDRRVDFVGEDSGLVWIGEGEETKVGDFEIP